MTQRFQQHGQELVQDVETGLVWTRTANPLGFPLSWPDALDAVTRLNRERFLGHGDWRLPNRRELRSLIDPGAKQPALPPGHPFRDVFLGWYWTSSTKAGQTAYAWNVHLEGGRMFYSRKDEFRLLWPVRGESAVLPQTGQTTCFDVSGRAMPCLGSGQDADLRAGLPWPSPRFEPGSHPTGQGVLDRLTGLCWLEPEHLPGRVATWEEAAGLARSIGPGWRLPDIDELESLVDADRANPALPLELTGLTGLTMPVALGAEGFWSSTTSGFDPAWAYVLYAQKGAVGVGFKPGREFHVWPVRE
ncbi:MAG: hypothetical protein A2051_12035 [Desulfovibrionales bacterium GWA2_65_9]|nr:MAG: hypothetical protein A2051_12035 [Desulfovibrionales bacterium GWA2_65_9]